MPTPRQSEARKPDQRMSGAKIAIITTLITALVGLISTILVVFFQNVFPILVTQKITQTAVAVRQTQTIEAETSIASKLYPSVMPRLLYYANANEANVYEQKDESSRVFDAVMRCTEVEVVSDGYDPDWLHVTYLKGNARYTGYVLTRQFTDSKTACEPISIPTP